MPNCKLSDCPIAKNGRCLEGRGADCPNLLPEGVSEPTFVATTLAPPPAIPPGVSLYSGNPLTLKEAREFSRRGRAVVVALVGLIESGKTSLIARLHQQFLAGPVGGHHFAGSRTLLRFEELNWYATVESGVNAPQMNRSSRQFDNSFLHFTVRTPDLEKGLTDVLINDISGETVQDAVATQSICEQLAGLARADHVVVVADGAALADLNVCYDHTGKLRDFVQRILQSGQIGKQTVLHLVVSKQDLLKDAEANAMRLEADFKRLFEKRVGNFHCWRIAARPGDGSQPTEGEIAKLFAQWIETSLRYPLADVAQSPETSWERDFCRFGTHQPQPAAL